MIYSGGTDTEFKTVARNNLVKIANIIESRLEKIGVDFNKNIFLNKIKKIKK